MQLERKKECLTSRISRESFGVKVYIYRKICEQADTSSIDEKGRNNIQRRKPITITITIDFPMKLI